MQSDEDLFRRLNYVEEEITFDNQESFVHRDANNNNNALIPVGQLVDAMGEVLDHADHALNELTNNDMFGKAIFRGCQDLADAVGHLASELEQQSEDDRRTLAQACLDDVQATTTDSMQNSFPQRQHLSSSPQMQEFAQMTPEDIMFALSGASSLLRDVEMSLRGIEESEADEIADAALTSAQLFLASLKSCYSSLIEQQEEQDQQFLLASSDRIERLGSDDDKENDDDNKQSNSRRPVRGSNQQQRDDRLRVLWPPLGPAVAHAAAWGKDEAAKKPLLAVALGITLWPAAVVMAFLGGPVVIADSVVQHAYNSFQDGSIVSNIEKGAAQAFQAGKLSLLCGKLIGRQSLRIANRQIERNGGIGPILQSLGGMAIDRALHPVETASAVWGSLQWSFGMVQEQWQFLHDMERRDAFGADGDDWIQ